MKSKCYNKQNKTKINKTQKSHLLWRRIVWKHGELGFRAVITHSLFLYVFFFQSSERVALYHSLLSLHITLQYTNAIEYAVWQGFLKEREDDDNIQTLGSHLSNKHRLGRHMEALPALPFYVSFFSSYLFWFLGGFESGLWSLGQCEVVQGV